MDKRTIAIPLGLEAEKRFEIECITRGIECYKSISPDQTDYVINYNSKLVRVQIKSTDSDNERTPIKCSWGQHKNTWKSYSKRTTDYIVIFIRKQSTWYLIPVEEVEDKVGITISPNGIYDKYKNNWNLTQEINTEPNTKEIIHLRELGESVSKISAKLGKSQSHIRRILRAAGLGIKDKLSQATEEVLKDLYINKKFTIEEIADSLDLSTWFIRNMFRKFNIKVRTNPNPYGIKGKLK